MLTIIVITILIAEYLVLISSSIKFLSIHLLLANMFKFLLPKVFLHTTKPSAGDTLHIN